MAGRSVHFVIVVGFILSVGAYLLAQTQTTGRIAGTVKDAQGAVIAGAEVIIESSSVQWSQTMRGTRSYHWHVPKGLKRFYGNGDLHFVTASCYHPGPATRNPVPTRPVLESARTCSPTL